MPNSKENRHSDANLSAACQLYFSNFAIFLRVLFLSSNDKFAATDFNESRVKVTEKERGRETSDQTNKQIERHSANIHN